MLQAGYQLLFDLSKAGISSHIP